MKRGAKTRSLRKYISKKHPKSLCQTFGVLLVFNQPCGVLRRKYCYWIWSSEARAKEYAPIEIALLAPRDEMATPVDLAGS